MFGCFAWVGAGRTAVGLRLCLCLFWLAARPAVGSQSPGDGPDWVVDAWQTEAGLPHNSITCLLQTKEGYLWIGTPGGLARFDGVRFRTFRAADGLGLRSNRILCLHEDHRGVLWIGTDAGGMAWHHDGRFTSLTTANGLSSDTVLCLDEDSAGELWIGTDSGLNRWLAGRFLTFFKPDGLPDDRVTALCRLGGSALLVATPKGLCQFGPEALRPFPVALPPETRNSLTLLQPARDGGLWLAGEGGLFWLPAQDAGRSNAPARISSATVSALTQRKGGEVWFGTTSGELLRAAGASEEFAPECLWRTPSAITALCEDREGNLWVGTAAEGLQRLKRRQLRLLPLPERLAGSATLCWFETPEGELRLLAGDKQLYQRKANQFTALERLPLPDGVSVQIVCPARTGELWIGTARDGLFLCASNALRQFSERDGLSDSAIEVLHSEADGGLWIGTRNGGLNHFKDQRVTRFNTPWGFIGAYARVLERDADGALWVGTTGEGLFQLKDGRFVAYTERNGLPSGEIHALQADADGVLWVGTAKGLCRIRAGRVATFAGAKGLPEEAALQLRSDAEGNLWVGSGSRLFRVSKAQLNACAEERARFVDAVMYGKEDGLPGIQCVSLAQPNAWLGGTGRVWFATTKGLAVFDPEAKAWNSQPPPVLLETVMVQNESVPFDSEVRVPPGKESLRFEFTALSLTAPGKVRFRYQLEGFDDDWSEPGAGREARYPKVPPGDYRFRVVACNNDGVWNETGADVAVVVAPFWWATVWFQLSVLLVVAGVLGGLYRLRQLRRRDIERLRIRIASDLHDDIGSSLWSITLLSRMLTKHGKLGPEERQDLDEIHRIAVQTSNSIRDIIWLINPAFDTVQDFVLRTKDFAAIVMRGVDYRMTCEGADLTRKLPFDFRHNLFLLFKEALTNIARHANATVVEVRIEELGAEWRLTIRDNGVGFDPAASTAGNGLRNLRARAARMGATLEVRSQPGQGTTLVLSLVPP